MSNQSRDPSEYRTVSVGCIIAPAHLVVGMVSGVSKGLSPDEVPSSLHISPGPMSSRGQVPECGLCLFIPGSEPEKVYHGVGMGGKHGYGSFYMVSV